MEGVTTSLLQAVQRDEAEVVKAMVHEIGGCTPESRLRVWAFSLGVAGDAPPSTNGDDETDEEPEEAVAAVPDRTSMTMDAELLLQSASVSHLTQAEVEAVFGTYCNARRVAYRTELSDLASPFLALDGVTQKWCAALLRRIAETYAPFLHHTMRDKLSDATPTTAYDVLVRLLLQYHDAAVCTHLDQHKVSPAQAILLWTRTLFVSQIGVETIARIWDVMLTSRDRTYPTFFALAAMLASRDAILGASGDGLQQVLNELSIASDQASLKALHAKAAALQKATPTASIARLEYLLSLTPSGKYRPVDLQAAPAPLSPLESPPRSPLGVSAPYELAALHKQLLEAVVLPIDAEEMVAAFRKTPTEGHYLKYMILDCRAAKSFNFARLPTAVHVGPNVGYDPEKMHETLERFEGCRGSHFCLLGTGKGISTEDNLLNILAMKFVGAGFGHVGIAAEGFKGAIEFIKAGKIEYVRETQPASQAEAPKESAGESVGETAKQLRESLAARAKDVDTDAIKKSAAQKADKMKKWGMGLYKKFQDKYDKGGAEGDATATTPTSDATPTPSPVAAAAAETKPTPAAAAAEDPPAKEKKSGMMARFGGRLGGGKKDKEKEEKDKDKDKKKGKVKDAVEPVQPPKKGSQAAFALAPDSDSDDFQLIQHPNEQEVEEPQAETTATAAEAPAAETAAEEPEPASSLAPEPELVFRDESPVSEDKVPAPAAAPAPAVVLPDDDDLFADPVLDTKPKHTDPTPKPAAATLDDDDLFADPFEKKPTTAVAPAAAAAPAAKKADVDIFADDFNIDDIELPATTKTTVAKDIKDDDFEDLFS